MNYILKTEKLNFSYMDGTKALKELSMKIPEGKKIAVIGNNGSGKTTLFLHFNGIHRPQSGNIFYRDKKMSYSSGEIKNIRKNVGIVFQDPDNQLFSGSVYQDISYGPVNLGWDEKEIRIKIEEVMNQTGTFDLKDKPTHFLSYGQKKRVAIAGVLAMNPEVMILDEPTAGLDPVFTSQIMELLNDLNKKGTTVIISSHNMDEVFSWADYVFVLSQGEIISEGKPEELFRDAEVLKKANLKKPWVLDMYDYLLNKGLATVGDNIPRTREELLNLIK